MQSIIYRISVVLIVVLLAACSGGGGSNTNNPDSTIDPASPNAALYGTYRFVELTISNIDVDPGGDDEARASTALAGRITFDGRGNWTASDVDINSSETGLTFERGDEGVYEVDNFHNSFDLTDGLKGHIIGDGSIILFSGVNVFKKTVMGIAVLEGSTSYKDADLDGTYRFIEMGVENIVVDLGGAEKPRTSYSSTGRVTFDGRGNWSAAEVDISATGVGIVTDQADAGTFDVGENGSFDLRDNLRGYLVDDGNMILFAGVNVFNEASIGLAVLEGPTPVDIESLDGTYRFVDMGVKFIDTDPEHTVVARQSYSATGIIDFWFSDQILLWNYEKNSSASDGLAFEDIIEGKYYVDDKGNLSFGPYAQCYAVGNSSAVLCSGTTREDEHSMFVAFPTEINPDSVTQKTAFDSVFEEGDLSEAVADWASEQHGQLRLSVFTDLSCEPLSSISREGTTYLRFQPTINNLPVYGEQVIVHVDTDHRSVVWFGGRFDDEEDVRVTPTVNREQAIAELEKLDISPEQIRDNELVILRMSSEDSRLAWRFDILYKSVDGVVMSGDQEYIYLDSHTGEILIRDPYGGF